MQVLRARNVADNTQKDVQESVEVTKSGKAPNFDGIATECLKRFGVTVLEFFVRL